MNVRSAASNSYVRRVDSLDFTKGVLQCIGVKQFQRYLELPDDGRRSDDGRAALHEALTAMKHVTKKYARRQTRWINNRFLKTGDKQVNYTAAVSRVNYYVLIAERKQKKPPRSAEGRRLTS